MELRRAPLVVAMIVGLGLSGLVGLGITSVMGIAAEPATAAPFGEIRADCALSHRLRDDPLVYPGRPGVAHSHDFFGPVTTNARSMPASLYYSRTTCDPTVDRSAYWFPTLSVGRIAITPERSTFHYTAEQRNPRTVRAYPFGLKMIAGDPMRRGPTGPSRYKWSCPPSLSARVRTCLHAQVKCANDGTPL